ncbi:MAG TPA: metal-dependent hydrolase [Candidatus Tectomicrobia bacterium]
MADNLTHGLAGTLLAQTGLQQRYGPAATVALVVGAELPDLDSLFALGGPVLSFVHHRGMTHSLLGGAGLTLLGALLLWRLFRAHPYWRLVLWISLGVVLHIGMDVLTPYGTQVFWPLTTKWYTANALFILDYFYTGLMVVALLLIRMVRQQRQRQYGLRSLIGLGVGSALWVSAPWLPPGLWWVVACSTVLFLAVPVLRVVRRHQVSRYRLMSLLGIGVGLGIVLWRMTAAFTRSPALQLLALQSGGMHLAVFAGVLGLGAWYGRRWHGERSTRLLGRCGVAAVLAYIGLCLVSHTVAQHLFARALGPQRATVERLTMLPLPGWGPVLWRGIAVTRAAYLVSRVTLVPPSVTPPEVHRPRP